MKNIIKLSNDLFLNEQKVNNTTKETVKVNSPVNHILVIDVSGSMSYELTKIRKQLINKLPNLVNDKDTVTIIWFSGKNECGILKEEVEIKSLKDLSDLNKAIERFLQPIGLTGFVNPLKLVTDVVDRISKNRPDSVFSMLFLTDGYDNQSSETEILKVVKLLEPMLNSCVFVEYGYYCNRNLLSKMAELVGGVNIFSEGFDSYDPVFEKQITKTIKSSKKIKVNLPNVLFNFVFSVDKTDNSITTYKVENNEILINENVDSVFYLTDTQDINSTIITINDELNSIYALLYCLSIRMKSDEIYKVLAILGDVELITFYINAFGKQNITTFQQMCLDVVNKIKQPYALGYVPNLVPKEDVYSLIDLFNDLNDDENNLWYPHNENFVYKRISSERIQKKSLKKLLEFINHEDESVRATVNYALEKFEFYKEIPHSGLLFPGTLSDSSSWSMNFNISFRGNFPFSRAKSRIIFLIFSVSPFSTIRKSRISFSFVISTDFSFILGFLFCGIG
jgi:hypothetical protein